MVRSSAVLRVNTDMLSLIVVAAALLDSYMFWSDSIIVPIELSLVVLYAVLYNVF